MQNNNLESGNLVTPLESAAPKQNSNLIAGAILLAGLFIAGAVLLRGSTPTRVPVTNNDPEATAELAKPLSKDDHIIGSLDARVVIVEYSDLECPFCKVFHTTMHRIVTEYEGDVAWVYRHYPIPELHQKATREAEATECAWDQGGNDAFWRFTDRVFEITTSNDGLPDSALPQIAGEIGLDVTKFNSCLSQAKYALKVQDDIESGAKIGVRGTPSSFILVDGKIVGTIPGAFPYEKVKPQLDALLK